MGWGGGGGRSMVLFVAYCLDLCNTRCPMQLCMCTYTINTSSVENVIFFHIHVFHVLVRVDPSVI